MSASIPQSIDALCKEHGIERDLVIEAMKEAVRAAARKQFKSGEEVQVDWTPEAGLEIFASKVIVEEVTNPGRELSLDEARELAGEEVEIGDELQLPLPMEDMGRIAAQTAKQILFQKVRDAVRANIYEQYIDKVGDLINGYVKRFERGDMIVDLGTVEAILGRNQQSRGEQWTQGERIRVVIEDVSKEAKGPQVIVSRSSPELLKRLFEMEVPEIYDGTVVIKSAMREPGERAKIAVASIERDVDPVGACVGMKGSRVQAIIRELRGEKIDIIEWSDEPSVFAANALSPAKVNQVRITDIERRQMEVIVNEDQLSLAIGKRGQNVRLATKLVGWNIDIRSEEEIKKEVAAQMGAMIASGEPVPIEQLEGITAAHTAILAEHGIKDIDALAAASVDELTEFLDISLDEAEGIITAAQAVIAASRQPVEGEAAVEEGAGELSVGEETGTAAVEVAEAEGTEEAGETVEQHAASVEFDPNSDAGEVEPSKESTAAGYDEAVEQGTPFAGEPDILAAESADPVAITEADPISEDELVLQEAGRDLRPDTITPAPDITSAEAAVIEYTGATMDEERDGLGTGEITEATAEVADEDDDASSPVADFDSEASAPEVQVSSSPTPAGEAETASVEDVADSEHPDNASGNDK
ncbi:MAG: transcription termination factor NusA [Acidobacteria bacterium]|nr:transcription termination factor NusA [Acidobacteriota bacterium]